MIVVHMVVLRLCKLYAKSLQSCPTLCDPIDGSPPGSPVPGILQERTLNKHNFCICILFMISTNIYQVLLPTRHHTRYTKP